MAIGPMKDIVVDFVHFKAVHTLRQCSFYGNCKGKLFCSHFVD